MLLFIWRGGRDVIGRRFVRTGMQWKLRYHASLRCREERENGRVSEGWYKKMGMTGVRVDRWREFDQDWRYSRQGGRSWVGQGKEMKSKLGTWSVTFTLSISAIASAPILPMWLRSRLKVFRSTGDGAGWWLLGVTKAADGEV